MNLLNWEQLQEYKFWLLLYKNVFDPFDITEAFIIHLLRFNIFFAADKHTSSILIIVVAMLYKVITNLS